MLLRAFSKREKVLMSVLAAVLLLAKIERGNLITIIEGVRYGMDPANIRVLLKY